MSETVLHLAYTPGPPNAHGNTTDAWAAPNTVAILAFDPGSSSEPREPGADRVISEPTLYLPPGVVLDSRDMVIARGRAYEVEGDTREWQHPDGANHEGNVLRLRNVEG